MEVYVGQPATKGRRQLDRSLVDLDLVTLELPRSATIDLGLVEHTQDKMESFEQSVFAYQHNAFDVGKFGKFYVHNHYSMVVDNRFGNVVAHYLQRLVAQVPDMIAGIAVVDIELAMVAGPFAVVQYSMIDQDEESQYLFEPKSLQIRRH